MGVYLDGALFLVGMRYLVVAGVEGTARAVECEA